MVALKKVNNLRLRQEMKSDGLFAHKSLHLAVRLLQKSSSRTTLGCQGCLETCLKPNCDTVSSQ